MDLFNPENYQHILAFFAGFSLLTFVGSLLCIPFVVARLPRNYFQKRPETAVLCLSKVTIGFFILFLLRNILGLLLFAAGFAMLFLPGQGILTMIVGIAVMSFPYKHNLVYQLTRPASIQKSLDWLRKKSGKEKFFW